MEEEKVETPEQPVFDNYKDKQKYYKKISKMATMVHVSKEPVKNKLGDVIGYRPGKTYRKRVNNGK